ncbi:Rz-like lysis system protein LysB [Serratia nematodiphila]|uniref:Rz-like lysis system protein LysB n=1 Tax=Serratia nematodiphila TaxID=458197 RepID=UPI00108291F6|nr:Rz-like lysis system protein LysB [Serratia nematodiphila]UTO03294.1 Rz-like lysis system protein LysB [Serratia nematodiphila]HAX9712193.1 LysB family phage lysis regulatory protein [Serratia marcescens]
MTAVIPRSWLIVAAIVLALAAALGWKTWRLSTYEKTVSDQQVTIKAQGKTIEGMSAQLSAKNAELITLGLAASSNNRAQAELRQQMTNTAALLSQRENLITRLYRENAELKAWADGRLPSDVVRLHARQAITGGAAYRAWLSEVDRLPVTGQ